MTDQNKFDTLLDAVIKDGSISDTEREVIMARGQELGYSQAEIEIIIDSRLSSAPLPTLSSPTESQQADIERCPQCGKVREPFLIQCLCKHWFTTARPNSTLEAYYQEMQHFENQTNAESSTAGTLKAAIGLSRDMNGAQRASIVAGLQIPNTKEDILEIISLAVSQAEKSLNPTQAAADLAIRNAWIAKGNQALSKARLLFAEDSEILGYLADCSNRMLSSGKVERKKYVNQIVAVVCGFVFLLGIAIVGAYFESSDEKSFQQSLDQIETQIEAAVASKQFDQALILVDKLVWTHDLNLEENQQRAIQYDRKRESLKQSILKMRAEK